MLAGHACTFVASREGLIELHATGWVLCRWQDITKAFLYPYYGRQIAIGVILNEDPAAQEASATVNGSRITRYERWQDKRRVRIQSDKLNTGVDLLILSPFCRFGIVSLWNGIRLAIENPSRAHQLPPASTFIKNVR
jgi:hypothetical protein